MLAFSQFFTSPRLWPQLQQERETAEVAAADAVAQRRVAQAKEDAQLNAIVAAKAKEAASAQAAAEKRAGEARKKLDKAAAKEATAKEAAVKKASRIEYIEDGSGERTLGYTVEEAEKGVHLWNDSDNNRDFDEIKRHVSARKEGLSTCIEKPSALKAGGAAGAIESDCANEGAGAQVVVFVGRTQLLSSFRGGMDASPRPGQKRASSSANATISPSYLNESDTEELKRLLELKQEGLIDADEYKEAKAVILDGAKKRRLSNSTEPSAANIAAPVAAAAAAAASVAAPESQRPHAAAMAVLFGSGGRSSGGRSGNSGGGSSSSSTASSATGKKSLEHFFHVSVPYSYNHLDSSQKRRSRRCSRRL